MYFCINAKIFKIEKKQLNLLCAICVILFNYEILIENEIKHHTSFFKLQTSNIKINIINK